MLKSGDKYLQKHKIFNKKYVKWCVKDGNVWSANQEARGDENNKEGYSDHQRTSKNYCRLG